MGIPNGPFRIRPERESPLVYLTNLKDKGGWHLVNEDIVDEVDLPNLWQAKLYEGVTESGQPFLLPLTQAGNPNSEGWEKSLQTGIAKATQGWVSRETDKQQKRFKIYLEQGVMHEPGWWDGSFEELAEVAFGNRIIDAKYLNRRKRTAWDDVEESGTQEERAKAPVGLGCLCGEMPVEIAFPPFPACTVSRESREGWEGSKHRASRLGENTVPSDVAFVPAADKLRKSRSLD